MKKYILIFIVSFLLFWGMTALRGGYVTILGVTGFKLSAIGGFLIMLAWSLLLLLKSKQLKVGYILLSIWIGVSILDLPYRICSFESTMGSLPTYLFWCLGIITGYLMLLALRKTKLRLLYVVCVLTFLTTVLLFTFYGYNPYLHKLSFGTFSGKMSEEVIVSSVEFQDNENKAVMLADFAGEYLILDIWSSGCGVCFEKFPVVQSIYDKYKENANITLYGLHARHKAKDETESTGSEKLQKRGYTFPNLSIDMNSPTLKQLGVDGFPTVLIFNPKGVLVFRGNIDSAASYISKLVNDNPS